MTSRPVTTVPAVFILALASLAVSGCNVVGYVSHVVAGDRTVTYKAEYPGLQNKSVAVVVALSEVAAHRQPELALQVSRAISAKLAQNVPGIQITNPQQVIEFQKQNPTFLVTPVGDILARLKVQRVVYVDVSDFNLHEPGNAHEWRGLIEANVTVAADDAPSVNDPVYSRAVRGEYPEGGHTGLLESDARTIQLGVLETFSRNTAQLFHDYEGPEH